MFRLAELFKYRELGGDISKMPELEGRLNAIKDMNIRVHQTQSRPNRRMTNKYLGNGASND
jgi:hypothetical protein